MSLDSTNEFIYLCLVYIIPFFLVLTTICSLGLVFKKIGTLADSTIDAFIETLNKWTHNIMSVCLFMSSLKFKITITVVTVLYLGLLVYHFTK